MKIKLPKIKLPRSTPTILAIVSCFGVVGTAVVSAMNTPKAQKRVQNAREEKGEDLTKFEVVIAAAPAYLPTLIMGASTMACIASGTIFSRKQQAQLVAAYGLLDQSYKNFRRKVNDLYGEGTDQNVDHELINEAEEWKNVRFEEHDPDQVLFYDIYSKSFFWRSMVQVKEAEYNLNKLFATGGQADLNDFYSYLDLPCTQEGSCVGWTADSGYYIYGYNWIDFVHEYVEPEDIDAPPYYIIRFLVPPTTDFMSPSFYKYNDE